MEREQARQEELVDLGAASEATLGADGKLIDFVGMMDQWGISND